MNHELEKFARNYIIDGLRKLKDECHVRFKQMYAKNADLSISIETVVEEMSVEKLNWAMIQIENSLKSEQLARGREAKQDQ